MGEITVRVYQLFIVKIVNTIQQIENDTLLIVKNNILDLIWQNVSINLFDLQSKNDNDNVSSSRTAVFLKCDTLH